MPDLCNTAALMQKPLIRHSKETGRGILFGAVVPSASKLQKMFSFGHIVPG